MNALSTKDLNKLRSQSKIIANRVEATPDENLNNGALEEIINAVNSLATTASKMKTASNRT